MAGLRRSSELNRRGIVFKGRRISICRLIIRCRIWRAATRSWTSCRVRDTFHCCAEGPHPLQKAAEIPALHHLEIHSYNV